MAGLDHFVSIAHALGGRVELSETHRYFATVRVTPRSWASPPIWVERASTKDGYRVAPARSDFATELQPLVWTLFPDFWQGALDRVYAYCGTAALVDSVLIVRNGFFERALDRVPSVLREDAALFRGEGFLVDPDDEDIDELARIYMPRDLVRHPQPWRSPRGKQALRDLFVLRYAQFHVGPLSRLETIVNDPIDGVVKLLRAGLEILGELHAIQGAPLPVPRRDVVS